jgi:high-affinity K+ transport system ATPase subunit B
MSSDINTRHGFEHPVRRKRPLTPRKIALAELIMTLALIACIVVAATAVTIGIARADALPALGGRDGTFAIAAFLALLIAVMGGITALALRAPGLSRRRD